MSISAMKQALEALALFASDESDDGQMAISAYETLRQAIAEAEKPAHTDHPSRHWDRTCPACVYESEISQKRVDETAKREHDLVGACVTCGAPHGFWLSAPPTDFISPSVVKAISKREWVGLTDGEMVDLLKDCEGRLWADGFRVIEAKLKEKNT
jgi:hypothetical protein